MTEQHTCIKDDGGTPNRKCYACEAEKASTGVDTPRAPEATSLIPGHPVWCAIHAGYFCSCLYVPKGLGGQAASPGAAPSGEGERPASLAANLRQGCNWIHSGKTCREVFKDLENWCVCCHAAAEVASLTAQLAERDQTVEQAFKAGWRRGYYDGGEHDCRMFTPTAELAWDDYLRRQKP